MLTSKVIGATAAAAFLEFVDVGSVTSGASPTVDIPTSDLQSGDLLVLVVCSGGDTTTPSGWTLPTGANSGTGTTRITTFYKISNGSETDFTLGNSQSRTQCGVLHYRPAGGAVTFGGLATNSGTGTVASTSTQSITDTPALIISHFCKDPDASDIGTVSGTNQRLLGTSDGTLTNLRTVDEFVYVAGTSTSRSETASYTGDWRTNALYFYVP